MTNDYLKNLPKKRMGAGALIFNNKNQLLIVKPTYRDEWLIPGGVVEEYESPKQACVREVLEETHLHIEDPLFLGVEWSSSRKRGESLQFLFYGGILDEKQISSIVLPAEELSDYQFVDIDKVLEKVGENLKRRITKVLEVLKNNQPIYFEKEDK